MADFLKSWSDGNTWDPHPSPQSQKPPTLTKCRSPLRKRSWGSKWSWETCHWGNEMRKQRSLSLGVELVSVQDKRAWSVFNVILNAHTPITWVCVWIVIWYNYTVLPVMPSCDATGCKSRRGSATPPWLSPARIRDPTCHESQKCQEWNHLPGHPNKQALPEAWAWPEARKPHQEECWHYKKWIGDIIFTLDSEIPFARYPQAKANVLSWLCNKKPPW